MRTFLGCFAAGALMVVSAAAQPTITALVNNYSYVAPGLPNYGIAPGSIFQIYGTNLGPAALVAQATGQGKPALVKTLGGVTMSVTGSDGKSYQPIPYYVSAGQDGAILPSATPVGNGTITVTYNNQTSAAFPIQVVKSAFGIVAITPSGGGPGPAAAEDIHYSFIGSSNAVNPGEIITLWGTGLGAGPGDETQFSSDFPTDIRGTTKVWIGSKQASIQYAGRSQYPGLDQINVYAPTGVSGCHVSAVVQNDNIVSNATTIAEAATGRICSDANGLSSTDLTALAGKGSANLGFIGVGHSVTQTTGLTGTPTTRTADFASAEFFKYTAQQLSQSSGLFTKTSYGSCYVYTYTGAQSTVTDPVSPTPLDAGASITMTAPSTSIAMPRDTQIGFYTTPSSTTPLSFIPDSGGTFSFSNGAGGADVKALNGATITLGAPLVWDNMSSITTVDRTQGVTVTWTGGQADTFVQITGSSFYIANLLNPDPSTELVAVFTCSAAVTDHTFTVPPPVLLALPPSASISAGGITIPFPGTLAVGNYTNPVKFTATGLDLGYLEAYFINGTSVTYK